jgi:hypothetical protein
MLNKNFIFLALVIAVYGNFFYIRDTLKGQTKPNRVSFFLWGLAPLISFFAQLKASAGIQIIYTLSVSILAFAILLASLYNKNAFWKISKFDILCGGFALLALIILITTNQPILVLVLSVLADFFAALPTLIKSYNYPNTETTSAYAIEIIGSAITLLTIHHFTFTKFFFAGYILLMNSLFTALLSFSPKKVKAKA